MNWIIIILAIVLVVILWYVYTILNSAPSVASNVDLSTTPLSITGDKIEGGTSSTYAIGCWIYVKNMPSAETAIFNYVVDTGATSATNNVLFNLTLSSSTPTLIAKVRKGTPSSNSLESITISNNLPIQSWVHVLVSVSPNYIDSYLNGKLVVSTPITSIYAPTNFPVNNTSGPTFMSSGSPPVIITGLSRWNTPLDPQTVWSYYSQGNGNATQQMLGSTYHLDVVFKKDSKTHNLSLF
jgi:hypothetical protein